MGRFFPLDADFPANNTWSASIETGPGVILDAIAPPHELRRNELLGNNH